MSRVKTFYEDNHLIAVLKPAGVLTQGDKTGDICIMDMVKEYLKEKRNKPGNVFLGLLHRLDRPVSGIVLLAKTSKGASRLSEQFRNRTVEKTYYTIVCGRPKINSGVLVNYIEKIHPVKSRKAGISPKAKLFNMVKNQNSKVGSKVNLYYETIKSNSKYSLLKIKIDTGKFHQIRAQLSVAGFPILGDVKYGGKKWNNEKTIALCATELSFMSATGERRINLKIGLPEEWPIKLNTEFSIQ